MISIRKSCFETNSSSMHSLAIWKKVKPYDDYYLSLGTKYDRDKENGTFELLEHCYDASNYEFHRCPYQQLTTPIEKLRYVVGFYISCRYPESEDITTKCIDREPEYYFTNKEVESELLRLIEKYTGYKKVHWYKETESCRLNDIGEREWYTEQEWPSTSCTNDSGEDVMHFVERKGITLEDLIFKPNYTIQVDGDEYQEFKDMFDFNSINVDNIEDISSGIDFWIDNIFIFYVDSVGDTWGPSDIPYLDYVKECVKDGNLIVLELWSETCSKEKCQVVKEFLSKYKGICKFKLCLPEGIKEEFQELVDTEENH